MSEPVQRTAHPTTTTKITATPAVSGRHHRHVQPGVKVVADLIPADDLAALYTLPSGRRRPVPIANSSFTEDIDCAIIAIGTESNPLIRQTTKDLPVNKWGYIVTDETGRTEKPGVFAGGDIVTGAATVIEAMGAGKRAAKAIVAYIQSHPRT